MKEKLSSKISKPELCKGYNSRSFDLHSLSSSSKKTINMGDLSSSYEERRKRSASLTSRIIDDYLREENTKELNKKEFEAAYQKVYGGDATQNTTLLISDSNVIWACERYTEAARFFL